MPWSEGELNLITVPHPFFMDDSADGGVRYVTDFAEIWDEVLIRMREFDFGELDDFGWMLEHDDIQPGTEEGEAFLQSVVVDIRSLFDHYFYPFVNEGLDWPDNVLRFRAFTYARYHVVAGGMSHGDSPSMAYDELLRLAQSEIFDEAFGQMRQECV